MLNVSLIVIKKVYLFISCSLVILNGLIFLLGLIDNNRKNEKFEEKKDFLGETKIKTFLYYLNSHI